VLDIGRHAGALVLYAPESLNGAEVEIRRRGMPWRGEHTAVRERHVLGTTRFAGVFGSLPGGTYELRLRGPDHSHPDHSHPDHSHPDHSHDDHSHGDHSHGDHSDRGPVVTVEVTDGAVSEATFEP
jgi:hypothetical protein